MRTSEASRMKRGEMSLLNAHILKAEASKLKTEAELHDSNIQYWTLALNILNEENDKGNVAAAEFREKRREYTGRIKRNQRASKRKHRQADKFMRRYHRVIRRLWDIP